MRVAGVIATAVAVAACWAGVSPQAAARPRAAIAPVADVPAPLQGWPAEEVAEGITLYRGTLGDPSGPGRWAVTVTEPGGGPGDLLDRDAAAALARRLRQEGVRPRRRRSPRRGTRACRAGRSAGGCAPGVPRRADAKQLAAHLTEAVLRPRPSRRGRTRRSSTRTAGSAPWCTSP